MSSLINKKQVREFALACASKRHHKFTRCGEAFFLNCNAILKDYIMREVASRPSKGKTL